MECQDVEVENISAPIISQFYGQSAGVPDDKYYPIIHTIMTNKKSDSDYIPVIYGPTYETIKVGEPFDERRGMSAFDEEDGNLTTQITILENTVQPDVPGTYQVMYEVTDTDGNKAVTTCIVVVVTNTIPTIQANNITILEGTEINLLTNAEINVQANDAEDGPITNLVTIKDKDGFNEKDPKPGTYHVVFTVTDTDHNTVEKTITVTVNPRQITINKAPMIHAENKVITVGDTFNPLEGVSAHDHEDGEIVVTLDYVLVNDVDTTKPGTYTVTYKVSDSMGESALKTITVTVKEKAIQQIEKPNEAPTTGDTTNTGDATNMGLMSALLVGSCGLLFGLKRKKY